MMNSQQYNKRYGHIPAKYKGGHCYKRAIDYMLRHKNLLLCHGWVTGSGAVKGVRYSHAWLEDPKENMVIDASLNVEAPTSLLKPIYYMVGEINEERVKKYTYEQMMGWLEKTRKAGPWEKEFDEYDQ